MLFAATWIQLEIIILSKLGFPASSVGKESTCNAGDPSSIPELGIFNNTDCAQMHRILLSNLDNRVRGFPHF